MSGGPTQTSARRKNIRLPASEYLGKRIYFVTLCCEYRRPQLAPPGRAEWLLARLRTAAEEHSFAIHAYCVMPDHLHLLAEGLTANSSRLRFVKAFKQRTSVELGGRLWQRSFYDYVLRRSEEMEKVAWYIWLNPVRKGLCARVEDFPGSGSFTVRLPNTFPLNPDWQPPWKKPRRDAVT